MNKSKLEELNQFLSSPFFLDMDSQKAIQIAKRFSKNKDNFKQGFRKIKLAIVSNFNIDFLIESLDFCLYQRGLSVEIFVPKYGTMFTELINSNSSMYKFKPDYILIWPTFRDIQKYHESSNNEIAFWSKLWNVPIEKNINIIQVLFDHPIYSFYQNSINLNEPSILDHITYTNLNLEKKFKTTVSFISLDNLIINLGAQKWHDPRMYNLSKQPFSLEAIPYIAQFFASQISSKLGLTKKVLVFDLDNTIWGGEIGDLGCEGISLGKETSEGESYLNFQNYIKTLKDLGIIIAVCSKNFEKNAKEPFLKHPDIKIKLNDISCFIANFDDKASNLVKIKNFLNVDYSSIVFVDDSKIECEWVKKKLMEVTVINLQGDPATFINQVDRLGLFVKEKITKEDKNRHKSFITNNKINKFKTNVHELKRFLKSLNPCIIIENTFPNYIDRAEELILKTNQFKMNLNTFSKLFIKNNYKNFITLRFKDKFNDYGIVVVLYLLYEKNNLLIKNWVMSCRVFDRNIEFSVMSILKRIAIKNKCNSILIDFMKSNKNLPALLALNNIGFKKVNDSIYKINVNKVNDNKLIKIINLNNGEMHG